MSRDSGAMLGLLSHIYGGTPMDYLDYPEALARELADNIPELLAMRSQYIALGVAAGNGNKEAIDTLRDLTTRSPSGSRGDISEGEFHAMLASLGAIEVPGW
jgi:hypothetical protein